MREIPYDLIRKKSCNHEDKQCFHLKPYSKLDIAHNKNLTKNEKVQNLRRYKNSCQNRNGFIEQCCSKTKKDISKLDKLLRKLKKPEFYGKPSYNKQGELESIELCDKKKLRDCGKGFRKLNAYEMCKIPDNINFQNGTVVNSFTKDCHMAQCNPQEKLANIDGTFDTEYTYEFDKMVSEAIKSNKLTNLKIYMKEDPKLTTRPLTSSYEGNTVYHEAFKYDAKHIIVYLFKTVTREAINQLNSNGQTVLHMAMKTNNPNAVEMCLRLGSNINAVNNLGETPIYNAIRGNQYHNVLVAVNKFANLYHQNNSDETPFIVAATTPTRNIDVVKLLVDNGSDIDDKTQEGKTILQTLLEKEELNEQKLTKKNREAKDKLDLNIEDEKIRTLLQNIKIKSLGLDLGKELSEEDTQKLEGILYILSDADKFPNGTPKFKMTVDFDTELKYPEDLNYPKEIEHSPMQPFNLGEMNFSHEPFYLKYKNMHKANLVTLKKIIMLTKWDSKNDEEKKLKIIDDIMTGQISFDSYKYQVFHENGITQEQEHLFDNIDEKSLFDFKKPESEKKDVIVKSKREVDEEGTVTDTPFNINYKSEKEIRMEKENIDKILDGVFDKELKNDYDSLLNSKEVDMTDKKNLIKLLEKIINEATGNALDKQKKIMQLKKELKGETDDIKKKEAMTLKQASKNKTVLLSSGIGLSVLGIVIFLYLIQTKKININFNKIVANYGG